MSLASEIGAVNSLGWSYTSAEKAATRLTAAGTFAEQLAAAKAYQQYLTDTVKPGDVRGAALQSSTDTLTADLQARADAVQRAINDSTYELQQTPEYKAQAQAIIDQGVAIDQGKLAITAEQAVAQALADNVKDISDTITASDATLLDMQTKAGVTSTTGAGKKVADLNTALTEAKATLQYLTDKGDTTSYTFKAQEKQIADLAAKLTDAQKDLRIAEYDFTHSTAYAAQLAEIAKEKADLKVAQDAAAAEALRAEELKAEQQVRTDALAKLQAAQTQQLKDLAAAAESAGTKAEDAVTHITEATAKMTSAAAAVTAAAQAATTALSAPRAASTPAGGPSAPTPAAGGASPPVTYTSTTPGAAVSGEPGTGSRSTTGAGTFDNPTGAVVGSNYAELAAARQHRTYTKQQSALINQIAADPRVSRYLDSALLLFDELYFSTPAPDAAQMTMINDALYRPDAGGGIQGAITGIGYREFNVDWLKPDLRWVQQVRYGTGAGSASSAPPAAHPATTGGGASAGAAASGGQNVAHAKLLLGGGPFPLGPAKTGTGITGGPDVMLATEAGAPDTVIIKTPSLDEAVKQLVAATAELTGRSARPGGKAVTPPSGAAGPVAGRISSGGDLSTAFFRGAIP